jgi:phage tail protein X
MSTPASYLTKTGDTVDYVCWAYYGSTDNGQVEAVLAANNGLADYGPILPAGVAISLPVITATPAPSLTILG